MRGVRDHISSGSVRSPIGKYLNRRAVHCRSRTHERILAIPIHSPDRLRKAMSYALPSRRIQQRDRRSWHNFSWRHFFFGGRRAVLRREEDKRRFNLIDRYHSRLMLSIVLLMCLSVSDGFLTLYLIDNDMYELNPLMAYLLRWGPFAFITGKFLLTSFGVTCLVVVSSSYMFGFRVRVKKLMSVMIVLYSAVLLWSTYLALSA